VFKKYFLYERGQSKGIEIFEYFDDENHQEMVNFFWVENSSKRSI